MYTEGATRKTCLEQQVQAYNQLFHILFLILNDFCHDGHRSNLTAVEPATRVGTTRHRADRVHLRPHLDIISRFGTIQGLEGVIGCVLEHVEGVDDLAPVFHPPRSHRFGEVGRARAVIGLALARVESGVASHERQIVGLDRVGRQREHFSVTVGPETLAHLRGGEPSQGVPGVTGAEVFPRVRVRRGPGHKVNHLLPFQIDDAEMGRPLDFKGVTVCGRDDVRLQLGAGSHDSEEETFPIVTVAAAVVPSSRTIRTIFPNNGRGPSWVVLGLKQLPRHGRRRLGILLVALRLKVLAPRRMMYLTCSTGPGNSLSSQLRAVHTTRTRQRGMRTLCARLCMRLKGSQKAHG